MPTPWRAGGRPPQGHGSPFSRSPPSPAPPGREWNLVHPMGCPTFHSLGPPSFVATVHRARASGRKERPSIPLRHELLAAVDVVGRPGQHRVGHEVDGKQRYVLGPDDARDGERGASSDRRAIAKSNAVTGP